MGKKRLFAFFLSAAMIITMLEPMGVMASEKVYSGNAPVLDDVSMEINDTYQSDSVSTDSIGEDLPENDELFAGYVDRLFFGDASISMYGNQGASRLEGLNLALYNSLKDRVQKVASGEIVSTEFEIPLQELGITQTEWTAEDLGVDEIMQGSSLLEAAKNAFYAKVTPDAQTVLTYLQYDCPLDFYWFDKTVGYKFAGPGISATSAGGGKIIATSGIMFKFTVASEYQDNNVYRVNTSLVQTAQQSVSNAKSIVKKYENLSDYEKLVAYKQEICNLVSYNTGAANGSTAYGNPWQLIWVFDGDESTNVVCEGYSKAFQYLCDLSEFSGNNVACYSVTGMMAGGTGAGPHMWNIVTMNDGKNYLVDVTNCDTGSIGADDKLFLVGASGSVSGGYTVTASGQNIIYSYDGNMAGMFGDILELSQTNYEQQACTEHTYGEWITVTQPTCTEDGSRKRVCGGCGHTETEEIAAQGHDWEEDYTVDKEPTCVETGSKSIHCKNCEVKKDSVVMETVDHDWEEDYTVDVEATCETTGSKSIHCKNCDETKDSEVIPAGHTYGEWIIVTQPTCVEKGSKKRICSGCGDVETEEIEATGHDWETEYTVDKEPTCVETGSKSIHCKNCDATKDSEVIPAGHTYGEWITVTQPTCTEDGSRKRVCGGCGHTETEEIAAQGHDWEEDYTVDIEATCETTGSKSIHCKNCDATKDTETIPAGHKYGEWVIVTEPTCTTDGSRKRVCSACQNEEEEKIAGGHDWETDYTIDVEATCETVGSKSIHCKNCENVKSLTEIPATGHSIVWMEAKPSSCTEDGNKAHYQCENCGTIFEDEEGLQKISLRDIIVNATGHTYKNVTVKATELANGYIADVCSRCNTERNRINISRINSVSLTKNSYVYTGKKIQPAVIIKDADNRTISSSNYSVRYEDNQNVGNATVIIEFKGNYDATIRRTFQIIPKVVKLSRVSALSRGFKVTWKKQTSQITGYEVQYSTSSKFTKKTTVSKKVKKSASKFTVKKLRGKKKYYVRIRAYKNINGSDNLYSGWSAKRKVVTKR